MKILLPGYDVVLVEDSAEVKGDMLYLYRIGAYKEAMYKLTYLIFGDEECYYCHRKLRTHQLQADKRKYFSRISMDHLIPQDFGGPTIPNNMRPACTECNSEKGNMFEAEYAEYKRIHAKSSEKKLYKKVIELTQELRRYGHMESIPKEWIHPEEIKNIHINFWLTNEKGKPYTQQEEEAKKYNYLTKCITITKNGWLVDGFNTLLVSTFYNLPVKCFYLENMLYCGIPTEQNII